MACSGDRLPLPISPLSYTLTYYYFPQSNNHHLPTLSLRVNSLKQYTSFFFLPLCHLSDGISLEEKEPFLRSLPGQPWLHLATRAHFPDPHSPRPSSQEPDLD